MPDVQEVMRAHVNDGGAIPATLEPDSSPCAERQAQFQVVQAQCPASNDPIRHAGVRLIQAGPPWLLALDAHLAHLEPCPGADVWP